MCIANRKLQLNKLLLHISESVHYTLCNARPFDAYVERAGRPLLGCWPKSSWPDTWRLFKGPLLVVRSLAVFFALRLFGCCLSASFKTLLLPQRRLCVVLSVMIIPRSFVGGDLFDYNGVLAGERLRQATNGRLVRTLTCKFKISIENAFHSSVHLVKFEI